MTPLANKPYCVWFNGHMRTFATLAAAQRFADKTRGRVGQFSDAENWWIEIESEVQP